MKKGPIQLDSKEEKILNLLMKNGKRRKIKNTAKVILLRASNKNISTIRSETGLSKRTIINYTNDYIDDKRKFLINNYNKSELTKYSSTIIDEFKEKHPSSYKDATLRIEKITGIKRSITQVRKFLNDREIETVGTKCISKYKKEKIYNRLLNAKLAEHTSTIREEFTKRPPSSYKDAALRIEKMTGIKRGITYITKFLKDKEIEIVRKKSTFNK